MKRCLIACVAALLTLVVVVWADIIPPGGVDGLQIKTKGILLPYGGTTCAGATAIQTLDKNGVASCIAVGGGGGGGGAVTSVNGTANRITAIPIVGDVFVNIAATYVGQASITTLGTITGGTWHGTTIDVAHGGTGGTTAEGAIGGIGAVGLGTSRVTFVDATHIQLGLGVIPLKVGGTWTQRAVTAAVSIDTTGLAASTTYFVYAFDNAGVTTLVLSATGHTTDATFGVEIKSGDDTRTLVGLARTTGATQFSDGNALRGVISWFARRSIALTNAYAADVSISSAAFTEFSSSVRATFVTWGDETVECTISGSGLITAGSLGYHTVGFDGTTAENVMNLTDDTSAVAIGIYFAKTLAEGFHDCRHLGQTDGTVKVIGNAVVGKATSVTVRIRG